MTVREKSVSLNCPYQYYLRLALRKTLLHASCEHLGLYNPKIITRTVCRRKRATFWLYFRDNMRRGQCVGQEVKICMSHCIPSVDMYSTSVWGNMTIQRCFFEGVYRI